MDSRRTVWTLEGLENTIEDAEIEGRDLDSVEARRVLRVAHAVARETTSDLIRKDVQKALDIFEFDPMKLGRELLAIAHKWSGEGEGYTDR